MKHTKLITRKPQMASNFTDKLNFFLNIFSSLGEIFFIIFGSGRV